MPAHLKTESHQAGPLILAGLLGAVMLAPACASPTHKLATGCELDSEAMLDRVRVLSAPELAGRGNGTGAALAAADTIAHWFMVVGLVPGGHDQTCFQEFTYEGEGLVGKPGRNVLGIAPGRGRLAGRFVVIGAHYDHLGQVESGAEGEAGPGAQGRYYPGADDNASGVTVLVELARLAGAIAGDAIPAAADISLRSCLFVSFAGEEVGLQGSAYLVNHPTVPRDSIDVMINLDSVGRLRDDKLYVAGVGSASALPELVRAANQVGLRLEVSRGGWDASDHVSFNTVEIPVLFLFTGAHPDYHRPTDSWQNINREGLERVAAYAWRLLAELRAAPEPFDYQAIAEASPPLADAASGTERKAWLGAIPDFTEEVAGVKLAGVIAGSPAEAAGLAKGDVLVGLAGEVVADLAGFAKVLRSHTPGERVAVEVLRSDQRLRFEVTLGDRSQR